jgi:hypothetical protein
VAYQQIAKSLNRDALKEYLTRRTPERIVEAMDAAIAAIGDDSFAFVDSAAPPDSRARMNPKLFRITTYRSASKQKTLT